LNNCLNSWSIDDILTMKPQQTPQILNEFIRIYTEYTTLELLQLFKEPGVGTKFLICKAFNDSQFISFLALNELKRRNDKLKLLQYIDYSLNFNIKSGNMQDLPIILKHYNTINTSIDSWIDDKLLNNMITLLPLQDLLSLVESNKINNKLCYDICTIKCERLNLFISKYDSVIDNINESTQYMFDKLSSNNDNIQNLNTTILDSSLLFGLIEFDKLLTFIESYNINNNTNCNVINI
jgi:hypothetical protein